MNITDYPTLHLDTKSSKGTVLFIAVLLFKMLDKYIMITYVAVKIFLTL